MNIIEFAYSTRLQFCPRSHKRQEAQSTEKPARVRYRDFIVEDAVTRRSCHANDNLRDVILLLRLLSYKAAIIAYAVSLRGKNFLDQGVCGGVSSFLLHLRLCHIIVEKLRLANNIPFDLTAKPR